jgi:hypothetical protein
MRTSAQQLVYERVLGWVCDRVGVPRHGAPSCCSVAPTDCYWQTVEGNGPATTSTGGASPGTCGSEKWVRQGEGITPHQVSLAPTT